MKKSPKGQPDRRKHPRGSKKTLKRGKGFISRPAPAQDSCYHCATKIGGQDRALFVEEEIGRIFCSEKCIADYFTPDIAVLEKAYLNLLKPGDLSPKERETYAHLRWITLQEPDEVWVTKTLEGDLRYTLLSQFEPSSKPIWSICICLMLRGDPSFLYLAFATSDKQLLAHYRKGEQLEMDQAEQPEQTPEARESNDTNRLAGPWTEDEMLRAQMGNERNSDDIPHDEFGNYERFVQETVESPDELWSVQLTENSSRLYHFLKQYKNEDPAFWYIVVARETGEHEEIEIVEVFPTRDLNLVNQYRRGELEMSKDESAKSSSGHVVH